MAPAYLGEFEHLLLLTVLRLGPAAFGVDIARELEARAGRRVSRGALYTSLDRLEDKGLVSSWLSDPTPERGGRSKRHYRLEANGERSLRESALAARRICDAVEHVWGPSTWSSKWKPVRQR